MFCQFCGTVLDNTARFCKSCGRATGEDTPIPTPALPMLQPQSTPPKGLHPAAKWGAGIAVVIIALAVYLATRSSSLSSSNFAENLNGVKLEMVRVPGGEFMMGSPPNEEGRDANEGPQHSITVPSFFIGKYEMTQAQWKAVMGSGNNLSYYKGDDLPVANVSWNDAKDFCQKLSVITGKIYRLPSEAEWEYACRAGTTGPYAGNPDLMAWYNNDATNGPHPVGKKQPNAFGLYDMQGNVEEWCEDIWHSNYNGGPIDGSAWLNGGDSRYRVLRSGPWNGTSKHVRSSYRYSWLAGSRDVGNGFRVVVSASTQNP